MGRIAGTLHPMARDLAALMTAQLHRGAPVRPNHTVVTEPAAGCVLVSTSHDVAPSVHDDPDLTVVLDGSIYNAATGNDPGGLARYVADAFRRHGFPEALVRFNGDFAIALFDKRQRALWLARDRFGVKPLYYVAQRNQFAFASRPRPLLALSGVDSAVNRRFAAVFAASHYRYFDNVPEESPYQQVAQLPAAHWLLCHDDSVNVGRYWQLDELPEWTESQSALAERYRDLLISAVSLRRAVAPAPAFTLSGGMDSSSVLACAAQASGQRQDAFSTVYSDKTFDESDQIRPMLDHSVGRWYPVVVDDPDVFSLVRQMVAANDEPVATATWLSHFVLCKAIREAGFRSVFGGLGGDELNAGEYEYFFFHFADLLRTARTQQLKHEIAQWVAYHDHPIHRKNQDVAMAMIARCTDAATPGRCLPDVGRMRRYRATLNPDFFDLDSFSPRMDAPFSSYLKTRTYQDLTRETAPCCLRAEDRQTEAFGLSNLVPFFDHRLVEFMFRVPGALKIRDGVTKILLREATTGLLPETTRTRVTKTGWNAPAHRWFSGVALEHLMDLVHSRSFRERGIYCVPEVIRIIEEHRAIVKSDAAVENHMMFLWQLVNLNLWLDDIEPGGRAPHGAAPPGQPA